MYARSLNPKFSCALYFMTNTLSVKSISPDVPVEPHQVVRRQRGTGCSGYFYLKSRTELNPEGEEILGNVWEWEPGNVNHSDSGDINCA